MVQVLKQNTVRFQRINSANVLSYEIYVIEFGVKTLIDTIPNKQVDYVEDKLEFTHSTSNKAKYIITPIINYSHTVGDHNIIR